MTVKLKSEEKIGLLKEWNSSRQNDKTVQNYLQVYELCGNYNHLREWLFPLTIAWFYMSFFSSRYSEYSIFSTNVNQIGFNKKQAFLQMSVGMKSSRRNISWQFSKDLKTPGPYCLVFSHHKLGLCFTERFWGWRRFTKGT